MNLIKSVRLYYKSGKSDKVYVVDLCEVSSQLPDRYLVNFRYGKQGANLREGTKTNNPTDLENAQRVFDSIVVAKTNKGYRVEGDAVLSESQPGAGSDTPVDTSLPAADIFAWLTNQLSKESDPGRKARLLWRLGDLQYKTDGSKLKQNSTTSNWLEQYALIFALCRCSKQGDNSVITTLARLCDSPDTTVSRYAFDALLHVSDTNSRLGLLQSETKVLTAELMKVVASGSVLQSADEISSVGKDQAGLQQANDSEQFLINYFEQAQPTSDVASTELIALYRFSTFYPHLHSQLLSLLKVLPFKPPFFKAIRHLFKVAEMTLDASVYAAISYRLDTTGSLYNASQGHCFVGEHGYLRVKEEQHKADTKLAYSKQTRQYLRRRSWRTLRRLAEAGNSAYVPMAVEQLLQVTDTDHKAPVPTGQVHRDPETQAFIDTKFAPLSKHFAVSQIVYGNSQAYVTNGQGSSWGLVGDSLEEHQIRTEQYPELWDKQAEMVLPLLVRSRSHDIHKFGIRLLKDHPVIVRKMSMETLLGLLGSPYPETNQLACEVAGVRLQENGFDGELLLALMTSMLPQARSMAIDYLGSHEAEWKTDSTFVARQLFVEFDDITEWRRNYLASSSAAFSVDKQSAILDKIIEQCFVLSKLSDVQYGNISSFTIDQLHEAAANGSLMPINRLLSEPEEFMQLFGADLLVLNKISFEEIPESLFEKISQSPWASVRARGIALTGKQSDEALLKNPNLLLNIYKQGEHPDRSEAAPIILRMADADHGFATLAVQDLVSLAFQSEKNEKQHEDIIQMYTVRFKPHWSHIDNDLLWRLLMAQSKAAQVIGAAVLTVSPMAERMANLSVMQWALLGHHQAGDVREHVRETYSGHVPRVREHTKDALKILDGNWLETREFAFQYFRDNYQHQDWSPELIIYICDNNRDDVQAFGRELLQRTFTNDQGEGYLLKLSQHPTTNVQLFASNFLREHAGGKPQIIRDLKPYFITVLSQVNRARITKDRVFSFLIEEAKQDRSVAEMVAEIFSRQSVTAVIEDKSILIESLLTLKKLYPDISMPVSIRQRPLWSRNSRPKNNNTQGVV